MNFSAILIVVLFALLFALVGNNQSALANPRNAESSPSTWINSAPLQGPDFSGKVVLIDFWTFACSNCQNVEPHIKALYAKYRSRGLQVIGVHTPELEFEYNIQNLREYINVHQILYPVVVDNDHKIWNQFGVSAWPTVILADGTGSIKYAHVGEGAYDELEQQIIALLGLK